MDNFKTEKSGKNIYRARRTKKRVSLNVYQTFCIVQHKNRWIVAFTEGERREFKSCHTINRTQAIQLINLLSEYINLVKPTKATALQASIKASANRVVNTSRELSAIAVGNDLEEM